MFQKKQIIYSETLGVCVVDNIVSLAASKREKPVPYYVLKPVFEDKVSYIPVEHHQVVLRDMFTIKEALELKETEQYEKDKHLKQAVDYVLDKVAIK
ncbi:MULTISPECIES: CarD-like/TRCF domain protein [Agathobacter]|uniref:CarD-like/TRCF domain protein n=1 Tax=Agathobacter rectalis TaxID=39491 RepID=UPI0027F4B5C2|nr:CarD-like/TRCF domain protein [Agathobacter rectalis]